MLDKSSSQPQRQPALGSSSILSTFEDREGNLWIGTETSGLDILRQQNFRTIPELSDHVITAIAQTSDGAMWVGTNGDGLDRWQSGKLRHYSIRNGLLSEIILALAPGADGSVWVGTPDGLNHIEGAKVDRLHLSRWPARRPHPLAPPRQRRLALDRHAPRPRPLAEQPLHHLHRKPMD